MTTVHEAGFAEIMGNKSNFDVELTFDDDSDNDGVAINSPFFCHFCNIFQIVESSMRLLSDEEEPKNKCYNPEVDELILNHFMPFIIMAAAILFADLLPEV